MRRDNAEIRITTQVNKECWKELKIHAVRKEVSLAEAVQEILERAMSKKSKQQDSFDVAE